MAPSLNMILVAALILAAAALLLWPVRTPCPGAWRTPGWPLLGSTVAFAIHGADVLAWAAAHSRDHHAFAVQLLLQRYVFLTSPAAIRRFASAPADTLALEPAVAHFTGQCFGISGAMWHKGEAVPGIALRKLLGPQHVREMLPAMAAVLQDTAQEYALIGQIGAPVDLASAIPRWVAHATLRVLFGQAFVESVSLQRFLKEFDDFDKFFEVRHKLSACSCSMGNVNSHSSISRHVRVKLSAVTSFMLAPMVCLQAGASPLPNLFFPRFVSSRRYLVQELERGLQTSLFEGTIAGGVAAQSGACPCAPARLCQRLRSHHRAPAIVQQLI